MVQWPNESIERLIVNGPMDPKLNKMDQWILKGLVWTRIDLVGPG